MNRVNIIDYKGKKIIYINNINATKEENLQNFYDFDKLVKTQPLKSVLLLHDITNTTSSKESLEKWKNSSTEHEKYVIKNALVGVKGLRAAILMAYKTFTRLKGLNADEIIRAFNTQEEAKEWLIQ